MTPDQLASSNLMSAFGSKRLLEAVLSEASHLPLLEPLGTSGDRQLVLVRYITEIHRTAFVHRDLIIHGAMWTDFVTTRLDHLAKVTGRDAGTDWKALNVVRLRVPAGFEAPDRWDDPAAPIARGGTRIGHEYWLRFDIPVDRFAIIPVDVQDRQLAPAAQASSFDPSGWLQHPRSD